MPDGFSSLYQLLFLTSILTLTINFIISIIPWWMIFNKAGKAPWKAAIPIVNKLTILEICNINLYYLLIYVAYLLSCFINLGTLLTILFSLANSILSIFICINLSKYFGKGIGFTLGLIFFPTIFSFILALDSSKYMLNNSEVFNLKNSNDDYIPKSDFFK